MEINSNLFSRQDQFRWHLSLGGRFLKVSGRFLALLPATLLRINGLRHLLNGGLGLRVDVDGKVWCSSQCGLSLHVLREWWRAEFAG